MSASFWDSIEDFLDKDPNRSLDENNHIIYRGGSKAYANTMAALTRAQYQDYVDRFQPIERELIGLATSGDIYAKQLDRNHSNFEKNFQQADLEQSNAGARFGLGDLRTQQQKTNLRNQNALSLASANNESREAIGNLQLSLMTGGSSAKQQINELGK